MGRPRKYPLDTVPEIVLDSDQIEVHPPRQALLNLKRHLEGVAEAIDRTLKHVEKLNALKK